MNLQSRRPFRRPSAALIIACIALCVAVGGTAWAAATITGSQIVNNSITGVDVKNGTLGSADLNASTRNALTDTSPWETIPSGRTITGEAYLDSATSGGDFGMSVQFGALAPVALTDQQKINFAVDASAITTDDDASCTGSVSNPTAPAGKVCLYLDASTPDMWALQGKALARQTRSGFRLFWQEGGAGDVVLRVIWAYHAP